MCCAVGAETGEAATHAGHVQVLSALVDTAVRVDYVKFTNGADALVELGAQLTTDNIGALAKVDGVSFQL